MEKSVVALITLLMLASHIGCGDKFTSQTEKAATENISISHVQSQLEQWTVSRDGRAYSFRAHITCYCNFDFHTVEISVGADDQIANLEFFDFNGQPVQVDLGGIQMLTIEDHFAHLEQAVLENQSVVRASFAANGFPISLVYDGSPMIADDEFYYDLSGLRFYD